MQQFWDVSPNRKEVRPLACVDGLTCCTALCQEARCVWTGCAVSWCLHTCLGPISACSHSTPVESVVIRNSSHCSAQAQRVDGAANRNLAHLKEPQVGCHYLLSLILWKNRKTWPLNHFFFDIVKCKRFYYFNVNALVSVVYASCAKRSNPNIRTSR